MLLMLFFSSHALLSFFAKYLLENLLLNEALVLLNWPAQVAPTILAFIFTIEYWNTGVSYLEKQEVRDLLRQVCPHISFLIHWIFVK